MCGCCTSFYFPTPLLYIFTARNFFLSLWLHYAAEMWLLHLLLLSNLYVCTVRSFWVRHFVTLCNPVSPLWQFWAEQVDLLFWVRVAAVEGFFRNAEDYLIPQFPSFLCVFLHKDARRARQHLIETITNMRSEKNIPYMVFLGAKIMYYLCRFMKNALS